MILLDYSHNPWLVVASIAVALMAGFTGLSLTKGASSVATAERKLIVAMAAIAIGGGIWSMHFVAMLGLRFPIPFYYDALITLMSALIAVLMVGLALLILHFFERTSQTLTLAGAIVGLGIVLMHFIGMQGMQVCRPVNSISDYLLSAMAAVALSILAIRVAYDTRTHRSILYGTLCFGAAVVAVHYLSIAQTGFVRSDEAAVAGPLLSNQTLAMCVTVAAFLICGAFLLTGVSFFEGSELAIAGAQAGVPPISDSVPGPNLARAAAARVPFERDGRTQFAGCDRIAAIRAEGHYTILYIGPEKLFCPWSITEAEARLVPSGFIRAHRSYLVNPAHVSGFERQKDTATLLFDEADSRLKVPVSRSRMGEVREALGL